jgi:hypothetical protein
MRLIRSLFGLTKEDRESSDFFFHFTPKIEHLINIMNKSFMPFYCMESLDYLNIPDLKTKGIAYPVICFCDLPLKRHKEHRKKFGSYGIGLKKNWGLKIENHLTPIIYSYEDSTTSASLKNLIELSFLLKEKLSEDDYGKYNNSLSTLLMHYKPYEGHPYDKGKGQISEEKVRFYEEREWRYIPLNCDGLKLSLTMEEYQNFGEENEMIQRLNKLEFELNDIEYIFLHDKTDLNLFLNNLSTKYTLEQIGILRKKIRY